MFNSKKKKAAEAKRQQKQLVQTALVAGGATSLAFAIGKAVEHFAGRKVRDAQADLRLQLAKTITVNAEAINQLQEEVAANAAASHEALKDLTHSVGSLADGFKELQEAGLVAAERRASLVKEIEALKAKVSGINGTTRVKPNGVTKPNGKVSP